MYIDTNELSLKELVKLFKKTRDENIFEYIENNYLNPSEYQKCLDCGKSIIFPNTYFRLDSQNKNKVKYFGTSCKTNKKVNGKYYYLKICDNCLSIKFGNEYNNCNKSKLFNRLHKITKYAFQINDGDYNLDVDLSFGSGLTKEKLIKKYGEEEGLKRWNQYREKQSYTNSFDYFSKTRGWTKEDFKNFNKKKAVTKNNLIKKYGKELGEKYWNDYINRQKYSGCFLQYFQDLYGKENGLKKYREVNRKKSLNLENFIRIYGKEQGYKEYINFYENKQNTKYSYKSQILFDELDEYFKNYKTYYATKNKEFGKLLSNNKYVKLDYFIYELNIAIEYNGDIFHANPKFFNENDKPNPFFKNLTAKEIWDKDNERYYLLEKDYNIKTIVIWESDNINIKNLVKNIKYEL